MKFISPLIREGIGWSKGDGNSIHVCKDKSFAKQITSTTNQDLVKQKKFGLKLRQVIMILIQDVG